MRNRFFARDLATSLTTFLFLVIAISGIMMFFHLFDKYVKELHEILGLAFVTVVLFHVFYNFQSMKSYFFKKVFLLSALSVLVVSLGFVLNTPEAQHPKHIMIKSMFNAPIESSANILEQDILSVKQKLKLKGISIDNASTIKSIADANKMSPFEIVDIIVKK